MKEAMIKAYIKLTGTLKEKKGQNTVEYLLMLAAVVGVALVVAAFLKSKMPEVLEKLKGLLDSAIGSLGSSS